VNVQAYDAMLPSGSVDQAIERRHRRVTLWVNAACGFWFVPGPSGRSAIVT
jgi:hypothetical protein